MRVGIRSELEAAKKSIRTEHVYKVTSVCGPDWFKLPVALVFFWVLSRSNFGNPVAKNFLEGNQVIGHPLFEDWCIDASLVA